MPTFSRGLFSILSLGTIRLAGFARLAVLTCRHHFELEFLAGIPSSLTIAFTSESERERARERQVGQERARERVRAGERAIERANEQESESEKERERERERAKRGKTRGPCLLPTRLLARARTQIYQFHPQGASRTRLNCGKNRTLITIDRTHLLTPGT